MPFAFQEDVPQLVGQGVVAGQQQALECPTDSVRVLHFRFALLRCVRSGWVPEEKGVMAMKSDPSLLGRRLWCILQPEVSPQVCY